MLTTIAAELGLRVESTFVPFDDPKIKTVSGKYLSWTCKVFRGDQLILETPYRAGIAHCPSYKQGRLSVDDAEAIEFEVTRGLRCVRRSYGVVGGEPILPKPEDVLANLAMDADAIDHPSFESWAGDYGFDTDSRKAEATYRTCLDTALKLRAAIGDAGLQRLRDAAREH